MDDSDVITLADLNEPVLRPALKVRDILPDLLRDYCDEPPDELIDAVRTFVSRHHEAFERRLNAQPDRAQGDDIMAAIRGISRR